MHKSNGIPGQLHLSLVLTVVLVVFGKDAGAERGKACLSNIPLFIDLYSQETWQEMEDRYYKTYVEDRRALISQGWRTFNVNYRKVYYAYAYNRKSLGDLKRGFEFPMRIIYDMLKNPGIYKAYFIWLKDEQRVKNIVDKIENQNGGCIEVNNIHKLTRKEYMMLHTVTLSKVIVLPKFLDACIAITSYLAMLDKVESQEVPKGFDWSSITAFFVVMFFGLMCWGHCCCYRRDVEAVFRQNFFIHVHAAQILQQKVANEQDLKRRIAQNEELMRICKVMKGDMDKIGDKESLLNAFEYIDVALENSKRKRPFAWKSLITMVMAFVIAETCRQFSFEKLNTTHAPKKIARMAANQKLTANQAAQLRDLMGEYHNLLKKRQRDQQAAELTLKSEGYGDDNAKIARGALKHPVLAACLLAAAILLLLIFIIMTTMHWRRKELRNRRGIKTHNKNNDDHKSMKYSHYVHLDRINQTSRFVPKKGEESAAAMLNKSNEHSAGDFANFIRENNIDTQHEEDKENSRNNNNKMNAAEYFPFDGFATPKVESDSNNINNKNKKEASFDRDKTSEESAMALLSDIVVVK